MKRIPFIRITAAAMTLCAALLTLSACADQSQPESSTAITEAGSSETAADSTAQTFPVPRVTLKGGTHGGKDCTLVIQNDTGFDWSYGADFRIRRADTREEIPFLEGIAWNAVAYGLQAGDTAEQEISFAQTVGVLPAGEYILEKGLFIPDGKTQYLVTAQIPLRIS